MSQTLRAVEAGVDSRTEILLLGDGPDPDVSRALAELRHLRQSTTDRPLGPPACFNRLAAQSNADIVILLESGAVPAPGALDRLIEALAQSPRVGLAGPSTNMAWNEQAALTSSGEPDAILQASRQAISQYGTTTRTLEPLYSLADFCLAVRRDVIDAIGGADEGYGLGPCWELEYNVRAARAGFSGVWVCGAYVWRAPFTRRRRLAESQQFAVSRRRYQNAVCGLRLRSAKADFEPHCRGDICAHFAPPELITLRRPLLAARGTGWTNIPSDAVAPQPVDASGAAPASAQRAPPLVSCIMPTRGRPDFVTHAVRLFQRQDYPNLELVIVSDQDDRLDLVLPSDDRIKYVVCRPGKTIGAKRNLACAAAAGAYIAQWDDDDWYGPRRLSVQMEPLLSSHAEISALQTWLFLDLPRWRFWSVTPGLHRRLFVGDVHGGTLVFARSVWQHLARYPDSSLAEDADFLVRAIARGARLERLSGEHHFVYLRHGSNAWSFECGRHGEAAGWRSAAEPELPREDRAFYAARASRAQRRSGAAAGPGRRLPLVSCVMPTRNRRRWVPQAIACFLRQDYAERELVIVDDGEDRVGDLVPDDPRVRYVALDGPLVLGAKRNRACQLARGELIAHWDDDDWQAPHRLSYQVSQLRRHDAALCGPNRMIYYEPAQTRAWEYEYPRSIRPWISGNAMCYRRELWRRNKFPPVQVGEDTRFLFNDRAGTPAILDDHRFVVALIHDANTSPKLTDGTYWSPLPLEEVRRLLGDDFDRYE